MTLSEPVGTFETSEDHADIGRLISLALPCPELTIAAFLRHAHGSPRFCWESSRDDMAFAGAGVALELSAWGQTRFDDIEQQARQLFAGSVMLGEYLPSAAPRLFGGFSFQDDFVPDQAWADFLPAHFVLPHFQLVRAQGQVWLTINAQIGRDEEPNVLLPELRAALEAKRIQLNTEMSALASSESMSSELHYPLVYEEWARTIGELTARMKAGELNKVVLARVAEAHFQQAPDIDYALAYVAARYPGTYRFLFEPRTGDAFYGATPELLVRVQDRKVETMALAGSAPRGRNSDEDDLLGAELLRSPKDRYEHQIVIDSIVREWQSQLQFMQVGETSLLKLSNIQHLHTPISGVLREPQTALQMVKRMHPTPALGGDPRAVALVAIHDAEPVTRGWYAAPIGYIDRNLNGAFAVAIRSAVIQNQRAWLYAGVGLVAQSDPQREWDETILKFKPMLESLKV